MNCILGNSNFDKINKIKELGEGVYSSVTCYKLRDGKIVAIKSFIQDIGISSTTLREIHILRIMKGCSNILQLSSVNTIQNIETKVDIMLDCYTCNLATFYRKIKLKRRIYYADTIISQLSCGLNHMINRGIIHRDIKPENILIDYDECNHIKCCFADFGLSRHIFCSDEFRDDKLSTEVYSGIYRPLELYFRDTKYTYRADIWAFGVTIMEYFTKNALFQGPRVVNKIISSLTRTYSEEYFMINRDLIHDHVDYMKILDYNLPPNNLKSINSDIFKFLEISLQINPQDRYSSTNKYLSFDKNYIETSHVLSRGEIMSTSNIDTNYIANVICWLIKVCEKIRVNARVMVSSIDIFHRYLSNFKIDDSLLLLLAGACLSVTIKFILGDNFVDIFDLIDDMFTKEELLYSELVVIRVLDYIISSDDINPIINTLCSTKNIYLSMKKAYKTIYFDRLYYGSCSKSTIIDYIKNTI